MRTEKCLSLSPTLLQLFPTEAYRSFPQAYEIVKHFKSTTRAARTKSITTLEEYSQKKIPIGAVKRQLAEIIALVQFVVYTGCKLPYLPHCLFKSKEKCRTNVGSLLPKINYSCTEVRRQNRTESITFLLCNSYFLKKLSSD